jgi:mRNA interferase RelE/StbE
MGSCPISGHDRLCQKTPPLRYRFAPGDHSSPGLKTWGFLAVSINRLFSKIENLSIEPRPTGCRKLTGNKHLWRIRVGNYRIVYSIDDNKNLVDVIAVRDRKDAYK